MRLTSAQLPKSQLKLTIEVPVDEMKPHLEKAAELLSQRYKIEGFRPGRASLGIVTQKLGAQAVWQEAAEVAIRATFVTAIRQENLKTIGRPQIAITKLAADNPLIYTAEITVLPSVQLGDDKQFKAKRKPASVSEAELSKAVEELREMYATEALVDRAAQAGDKVEVDFDIAVNRVPLENGSSKQHPVVIGSKHFIPGFEEQLVGLKKDETKTFSLNFPKEYQQREMAGKSAEFTVKVTSVFQVNKPELNDAFAKQVGKFETLEALQGHLRKNLQAEADEKSDVEFERALIDELIDRTRFGELPELLVESEIGKMLSELKEQVMRQGGLKFEDYLRSVKKTEAELRQEFRRPGERRVKAALVIRTIAERENITVADADVEAEVQSTLKLYDHDPDVRRQIDSNDYRDYVRAMLVNRKVISFLKQRALKEK